jgi:hypothetical protein
VIRASFSLGAAWKAVPVGISPNGFDPYRKAPQWIWLFGQSGFMLASG